MSESEPGDLPVAAPPARSNRWVKGQSGNPRGRKPKDYGTAERIRAAIADELPQIIAKVVAAARGGDMQAARTLLTLTLPPLKPVEQTVRLDLPIDASLSEQGKALMQAVARGEVAPTHGAALMMGLASHARVIEVDDLARRVAALEVTRGKEEPGKSH